MKVDFAIDEEHLDDAYQALQTLNTYGSYLRRVQDNLGVVYKDAFAILEIVGFATEKTSNGDLRIWGYEDKTGIEKDCLVVLAPFVRDGSYIEWQGENGGMWCNVFRDGSMESLSGQIDWLDKNGDKATFRWG